MKTYRYIPDAQMQDDMLVMGVVYSAVWEAKIFRTLNIQPLGYVAKELSAEAVWEPEQIQLPLHCGVCYRELVNEDGRNWVCPDECA